VPDAVGAVLSVPAFLRIGKLMKDKAVIFKEEIT
jgi:hypothetical protein